NSCANMAYMSTYVTRGRGKGIVTAIGMDTRIGHIADMLHETGERLTPLQKKLGELGKVLSILAVAICALLFVIAVWQKRNVGEMLLTSVSLTVAAVPEGLPAIVTIVLALSVSRMVRARTIVRKLSSVETLGAVDVVCSDKTGTLTQNRMTVTECYLDGRMVEKEKFPRLFTSQLWQGAEWEKSGRAHFLLGCVLCNDAFLESNLGDPTEMALVHMAKECGLSIDELRNRFPRQDEKGFDSERKMMTTSHLMRGISQGSSRIAYSKGAAEKILERCTAFYQNGRRSELRESDRNALGRVLDGLMGEGRRVLAIAMKPDGGLQENEMVFLGFVSMQDPVRPEAMEAVEEFRKAGVSTVMITGDHRNTAFSIARQLGIAESPNECISGRELDTMEESTFLKKLPFLKVFARVTPEHKVKIVEGFRKLDKTVAMTGDGVNDAPALKIADVGVAMGSMGSDIAVDAADIALMSDDISKIPYLKRLSNATVTTIKLSITLSMCINFIAVTCSVLGVLNPTTGALVHNAGSCFVVLIAALLYDRNLL
ncbi:MAG: HAD-IC family P-type ATPase, partial [Lachnospiraceae bacterium]|nr:HAD-IC family P-type ATPase [Lachnospiraceae bacterium]